MRTFCLYALTLLTAFHFSACDFDQGLGPLRTKIFGQVIFIDQASRPKNVDEVRVVAVANLPPLGVSDIFFSEALDFESDTVSYEVFLPLGNYPAVAVLWKPRDRDWELTSLLGFYGLRLPLEAQLRSVQLTSDDPVVENIDIFALWAFAQFDSRVAGTITFQGNFPADTDIMVLGSFVQVPQNTTNLLNWLPFLSGLDVTVPTREDLQTFKYEMAVRHGDHHFVGLFWKGKQTDWEDMKIIGFYRAGDDPTKPGAINVAADSLVSNVDFVAYYDSLPQGLSLGGGQ